MELGVRITGVIWLQVIKASINWLADTGGGPISLGSRQEQAPLLLSPGQEALTRPFLKTIDCRVLNGCKNGARTELEFDG